MSNKSNGDVYKLSMATGMEEEDRLEYEAEVAYITATSPVQVDQNRGSKTSFSDFEFQFSTEPTVAAEEGSSGDQLIPVLDTLVPDTPTKSTDEALDTSLEISLASPTVPDHSPSSVLPPTNPLASIISPPHYKLNTDLPSTPKAKLKCIQEAQTYCPPSPRTASPTFLAPLNDSQLKYKTLVVYGTTGCGKTGLVEKLVLTNPAVFAKVISSTTRKKRAVEVEGVDFHYISEKEMSLGAARGEYLEYVQQRGQAKNRRETVLSRLIVNPEQRQFKERRMTTPEFPAPEPRQLIPTPQRAYSKFDLVAEDSPTVGVKMFGTTKQALVDAGQLGKPCVVLNISLAGAQQLKKQGTEASFVLIHLGTKPPKDNKVKPDYIINSEKPKQAYSELQQYAFQLIEDLNFTQTTRFEITKHEWEGIPTVEIESSKELGPRTHIRPVSFSEVLMHFQSTDLSRERRLAKTELPKEGIMTRAKLNKKLHGERLLVFSMALCSLNDRDKLHLRTLQTIYTLLTGSSISCRRFGTHWKDIGFNGVDPADDLQGVGIFGLAQLLYFLDNPRTVSLAREIYRYSRQESHIIPFCVLSFNMTQIALSALRGGFLTKLANKNDQVMIVVNDFYTSTFYRYFNKWRTQSKSILELGPLIQTIGEFSKKHARDVINDLESYLSTKEELSQGLAVLPEANQKPFSQLAMDDYSDV